MKKIIISLILLLSPGLTLADIGDGCFGSYGMMGGVGLGYFGMILNLLIWIAIIAAIIYGVKYILSSKEDSKGGKSSAIDILKERYAKGEINKEEFENKKKDLE